MSHIKKSFYNSRCGFAFFLLFILIIIAYSNTLNSSWHLDDYQSILNNRFLHIKEISIKSLSDVISQRDYGNFTRPLSQLTFAINWYFGKDNVKGYHIVNTGIHVFSAFFLFLTILMLFKTPNLKNRFSEESAYFISLLSALLWAVNPVQTQAVTYIVQRMSSMAAMFYIIGLFCYIKGRLSDSASKKNILYVCVFLSYVFAITAKENAVTLPIAIVIAEIIFFRDTGRSEKRRRSFWAVAITISLVAALGIIVFLGKDLFNIFQGYENRNFTPVERLLTEARVIVYYLSLIFYPAPTRLSIEHDIDVSASFFYPWTTTPSIIFIVILIGLGIWQARKRPLLSFAILFFFLNHVIESSVIGLELIFEHRNYLPSFFLFVPVSTGLKWLIDKYHYKKGMFYLISAFVILLVTGYVSGTYIRNMKWASEISLMMDAVSKAPESARSLNNFAKAYYEGTGQYDKAIELYRKALFLKTHNRYYKAFILNNIAGVYYHIGDHERAGKFWEEAVRIYPAYDFARYGLAMVSVKEHNWDRGFHYLDNINPANRENTDVLNMKGIILFYQGKYEDALSFFRKGMIINSDEIKSSINTGAAYCLMGKYGKAGYFLTDAHRRKQDDIMTLLWLIETGLRAKDDKSVNQYTKKMCSGIKTNELVLLAEKLSAKRYSEDGILTPVYQELIAGKIYEIVKDRVGSMNVRQKSILTPQKK